MKHLFRRCIVLCIALCVCSVSAHCNWINYTNNGLMYYLMADTKTASVACFNYNDRYDIFDVVIPDYVEYEGERYKVTKIEPRAFRGYSAIKSISISGNVEEIGENAFGNCRNLESVRFEDSENPIRVSYNEYIQSKNEYQPLFYDCPIKKLYLGRETTFSYDENFSPFYKCESNGTALIVNSLQDVTIGKNVKNLSSRYFMYSRHLKSIVFKNGLKSIGEACFYSCDSLVSISLPLSIERIGVRAFSYCSSLKGIEIPELVQNIPDSTFMNCTALEYVKFKHDIDTIGAYAFYGCQSLKEVDFGHSLKVIGERSFERCFSLSKITSSSNIAEIGAYAFSCCRRLKSFTLPNSITTLNDGVFSECSSLTSIIGIECIRKLGKYLFSGCESICEIELSDDIAVLPEGVFERCKQLTSINLGSKLSIIEKEAFYGCDALKLKDCASESLEEIGEDAFWGCKSLENIPKSYKLRSMGESAFYWCTSIKRITIPASVISIGSTCFANCSQLTDVIIEDSNKEINFGSDWLKNTSLQNLYVGRNFSKYAFSNSKSTVKNIDLGCNVTKIPESAFSYYSILTHVSISNSVTEIGSKSFEGCRSLTSIEIPDNVTSISDGAFRECKVLEDVILPLSLKSMGEDVFENSKAIKNVVFRGSEPVEASSNVFDSFVYENATLYVNSGQVNLFKRVSPWGYFHNITDKEYSGIESILSSDNSGIDFSIPYDVYDLNGIKVADSTEYLPAGYYIVSQGNTVKKIVVK